MNRLELDLTTMGRGPTERGRKRQGLDNEGKSCYTSRINPMKQFVAKAQWRATAKTFLIRAADEETALIKAQTSREAIGCLKVEILRQLPSPRTESS